MSEGRVSKGTDGFPRKGQMPCFVDKFLETLLDRRVNRSQKLAMKRIQNFLFKTLSLGVMALGLVVNQASGAAIAPGDLVIYRVDGGGVALGNAATSVFLDEYTVTGTLVQSLAMPTTGATALTAVGNSTTEGVISRSQDGTTFIFTGYRKNVGLANPSADTAATTGRVIGALPLSGVVNTTVALRKH
ncbi:MAG: hypothetical protein EXS35_18415 [Pedosphaera sp.]|nr:hypothetical protein [Pedosphaera sp.]